MKISVLLPAYNASRTIESTIKSVLSQTVSPAEFIVLDDGSTDATAEIVQRHGSRIRLISTQNQGAAAARNALCSESSGDLLAFLDADDLWHPQHLEKHCALATRYPEAVASFSDHLNFVGYEDYLWEGIQPSCEVGKLIPAFDFFQRYHKSPGPFSSMSFCTVPRSTLARFSEAPFQANGAEDYYFFSRIPLLGPVAYTPEKTVAYRFHPASLSSNRLRVVGIAVQVYELLEQEYKRFPDKQFHKAFCEAFASKRRHYAKLLLGSDAVVSARDQLRSSLWNCPSASSITKSLGLLAISYFPPKLRPRWPENVRSEIACQAGMK
jgi:Glycosyltransferases involved in cell wall biogenesis